jgi:hypothetical protein
MAHDFFWGGEVGGGATDLGGQAHELYARPRAADRNYQMVDRGGSVFNDQCATLCIS